MGWPRDIKAAGGRAIGFRTRPFGRSRGGRHGGVPIVDAFGRLDVLHNNAALTESEFLSRRTPGSPRWRSSVRDQTIAVNSTSQMLTCKHAIPEMLSGTAAGPSSSMSSGLLPSAATGSGRLAGVSKAGVHTLTMYVATSHGKRNIRVNTIVPGLIITDAVRAHIPANALVVVEQGHRTPHLGEPDDIADLVVFLSSEESKYITGQMIAIDGGMSVHAGHVGRRTPSDAAQ